MCYHVRGSLSGTATDWNLATVNGDPSLNFRNDYDKYLEVYNDFTSRSCNHKLNCFYIQLNQIMKIQLINHFHYMH